MNFHIFSNLCRSFVELCNLENSIKVALATKVILFTEIPPAKCLNFMILMREALLSK